jgi:hypothetical protein
LSNIPDKFWKCQGDPLSTVIEMSQAEKDAITDFEVSQSSTATRVNAKAMIDGFFGSELFHRAFADIIKDEINILRQWLTDFKADVAASVSLADLKARVALLSDLPDRNLTQLKNQIKARIDSGDVDE